LACPAKTPITGGAKIAIAAKYTPWERTPSIGLARMRNHVPERAGRA